jgi:hypothetical protein
MAILPRSAYWTAEEDRRLRILWDAEWSTLAIAVTLNRSRSGVCGRARRLNLAPRPSPIPQRIDPDKVAQFRREVQAGNDAAREAIARAA